MVGLYKSNSASDVYQDGGGCIPAPPGSATEYNDVYFINGSECHSDFLSLCITCSVSVNIAWFQSRTFII